MYRSHSSIDQIQIQIQGSLLRSGSMVCNCHVLESYRTVCRFRFKFKVVMQVDAGSILWYVLQRKKEKEN